SAKFFPALSAVEIDVGWSFRHKNTLHVLRRGSARCSAEFPPDWILRDQDFCARVLEQFPLLIRGEFVVERDQSAAGVKNSVSGNQPFGLIRHDDASAIARGETRVLKGFC